MSDGPQRTRTFEVAPGGFTFPDLTSVGPVGAVTDPVESDTAATFFDTVDLRLAARQIALRRTASGSMATWNLWLADAEAPSAEVRVDLDPANPTVPEQLTDLVRASVRDRDLTPVASLRSVRLERRLLDAEGRELARIAEAEIHGQRFTAGRAELSHWREIDIELVGGDHAFLDAVSDTLGRAGVTPSTSSTLHRALGRADRTVLDLREALEEGSAGAVVARRLREDVARLVDRDWALRTGRPDGAGRLRATATRLRSDLATWRPFLDADRTEPVRRELRWLSGLLGRVCDVEMLEARVLGSVRDLPAEMVVGPVIERIERELGERRTLGTERLAAAMDGMRYFALLDALEALVADPPLTARGADPAETALAPQIARMLARLDRAVAVLDVPSSPEVRGDRLHDVRKAAKRVEHAAEAVEAQFGRRARRLAEQMGDLQDVLGEYQDSVVARQALREIGAAAHVAGESAFTYGILHGIEHDRGAAAERTFESVRQALGPSKATRWAGR